MEREGLFAIYSFLFMPWVSLGFLGRYTAAQMTPFAIQTFQIHLLSSLWTAFLIAGAAVFLPLLGWFRQDLEPRLSVALTLIAAIALSGWIGSYVYLSQQQVFFVPLTAVLGTGFWFYAFSMALVFIGGIIQLMQRRPPVPQSTGLLHDPLKQVDRTPQKYTNK